jgi:hypothetical protein
MDKRKNIEKGKKAIELYKAGLSMQKIAAQLGGTRQSIYDLLTRRSGYEPRKAMAAECQYFNGKKYTKRQTGYFMSTKGKRTLMHRDVWEFYNGAIPENYDIHHVDQDRANNKIENLEMLLKSEHARIYSTGHNQYTKRVFA